MTETEAIEVLSNNEVNLIGRVSRDPVARELPSGDELVAFRLVLPRPAVADEGRVPRPRRKTHDTIDCVVWSARMRRTAMGWNAGDTVRVNGSLRRRFYAASGGSASLVEVEVARGQLIQRGDLA